VLDAVLDCERNVEFEFDLIRGVSHDEAMRRIGEADLFIDQVLAGWYGGAAVEAMMLAVPVVGLSDRTISVGFPPTWRATCRLSYPLRTRWSRC
jgi:hypothetical protein